MHHDQTNCHDSPGAGARIGVGVSLFSEFGWRRRCELWRQRWPVLTRVWAVIERCSCLRTAALGCAVAFRPCEGSLAAIRGVEDEYLNWQFRNNERKRKKKKKIESPASHSPPWMAENQPSQGRKPCALNRTRCAKARASRIPTTEPPAARKKNRRAFPPATTTITITITINRASAQNTKRRKGSRRIQGRTAESFPFTTIPIH